MAKPRGQTLQQRFGFLDDDLRTASHDDVLTWLTEHIEQVIIELFWDSAWPAKERLSSIMQIRATRSHKTGPVGCCVR
jgi:hypothetical protein